MTEITAAAKNYLLTSAQLVENFAELFYLNPVSKRVLDEVTIDLSQIKKRVQRLNTFFDVMMQTSTLYQYWGFIKNEIKDDLQDVDSYLNWISNVDQNDIQISKDEVTLLLSFKQSLKRHLAAVEKRCDS